MYRSPWGCVECVCVCVCVCMKVMIQTVHTLCASFFLRCANYWFSLSQLNITTWFVLWPLLNGRVNTPTSNTHTRTHTNTDIRAHTHGCPFCSLCALYIHHSSPHTPLSSLSVTYSGSCIPYRPCCPLWWSPHPSHRCPSSVDPENGRGAQSRWGHSRPPPGEATIHQWTTDPSSQEYGLALEDKCHSFNVVTSYLK